jgi:hypothetical protein
LERKRGFDGLMEDKKKSNSVKAFLAFVALTVIFFVVVFFLVMVEGAARPTALSWWLVGVGLALVAIKFIIAETFSRDGFQLSKGSVDLSLSVFGAITSLAVVQAIQDHIVFPGPWGLLHEWGWAADSSLGSVRVALGWFALASLLIFLLISVMAYRASKAQDGIGKLLTIAFCCLVGCASFSMYFMSILFKDAT